jgi:hypothetical protein
MSDLAPKPAVYPQREPTEDEISGIGLILDEAITFKKVQDDLVRLLSSDCPDAGICAILDIPQELLDKFKIKVKRKIRKVNVDLGLSVSSDSNERSFWEFVKETTGDIDLLGWSSYYSCLGCVRKEANSVIHTVDKSFHRTRESHAGGRGIFFQHPDLITLLRLNFRRKYHSDIVKHVIENKLIIFKISCKEVDRTTLLSPDRVKGEPITIRKIKFIQVQVLENLFNTIVEAHMHANQVERDRLLEITVDSVLMPPYT